jgi:uncharacterized membrane protein
MKETTEIFGIPVPSTDPVFLAFVVAHILISLLAVLSGFFAMLSDKRKRRHALYGKLYLRAMLASFCTVIILSIMRSPHNIHLLCIGVLAIAFTFAGYRLARKRMLNWTRFHTMCMGASYILLMTGFYVDNGKNLPFWRLFPQWFFWVFPALVGIPIIVYALNTNPLNRKLNP